MTYICGTSHSEGSLSKQVKCSYLVKSTKKCLTAYAILSAKIPQETLALEGWLSYGGKMLEIVRIVVYVSIRNDSVIGSLCVKLI